MEKREKEKSVFIAWVWIIAIAAFILIKGFFAFHIVGDLGPPDWDYRPVKDVPAESPYATYKLLPNPQHIRGKGGK